MENFVSSLQRAGDAINKASRVVLGILTIVLAVVVIGQVVLRQFSYSLRWASEFSCYIFVWTTMLGSAVASKHLLHIGVDVLINMFHGKAKKYMLLLSNLILMAVLVVFIFSSASYTIAQISHLGVSVKVSVSWFYSSLPICGVIMLYHTFVQFMEILHYGETIPVPLPEDIEALTATEVTE